MTDREVVSSNFKDIVVHDYAPMKAYLFDNVDLYVYR